jgi:hypothetical protein
MGFVWGGAAGERAVWRIDGIDGILCIKDTYVVCKYVNMLKRHICCIQKCEYVNMLKRQ